MDALGEGGGEGPEVAGEALGAQEIADQGAADALAVETCESLLVTWIFLLL